MKFGIRKPSLKKSLSARTTGRLKRRVKGAVNPLYGKKGTGWLRSPKRALYNKAYRKTTVSAKDAIGLGQAAPPTRGRRPGHSGAKVTAIILIVIGLLGIIGLASGGKNKGPQAPAPAEPQAPIEAPAESSPPAAEVPESVPEPRHCLEIHMLDVGQGLSVLIAQDGRYLLYDGGPRGSSSYVVAYLKEHLGKDQKLDYIISSHDDEDHIAGLVGALNVFQTDRVIRADGQSDTAIYRSFTEKLAANGARVITALPGDSYELGSASFRIISPDPSKDLQGNNGSVAIRLTYGSFSALLCGDAEFDAEAAMLASGYPLASDLYVVSHHGSETSSSDSFLAAVSPSYAFLSVGAGNSYGHPAPTVMEALKQTGCRLFRTDLQGEVICTVEGDAVTFNVPPCEDWTPGLCGLPLAEQPSEAPETQQPAAPDRTLPSDEVSRPESPSSPAPDPEAPAAPGSSSGSGGENPFPSDGPEARPQVTYVLNTSSEKFHLPGCSSVAKIADGNRRDVTWTRDEITALGYAPCKICSP